MKISEKLKESRADRPDEWTMDSFIEEVERLELAVANITPWLSASLTCESCEEYSKACNDLFKVDHSSIDDPEMRSHDEN